MWWLDAYDLIFGIVYGVWLGLRMHRVPVTTKVILPPDHDTLPELPDDKSYFKAYAPVIAKLEVGGMIADGTRFNQQGSMALAKMMKDMAKKLDIAVKIQLAKNPEPDPNIKKFSENAYTIKQARVSKPTK